MLQRVCSFLVFLTFSFVSNINLHATEAPNPWEWHAVKGTVCRDGSETGYFLKRRVFDQRVVMLLAPGGACFNLLTCGMNPNSVGNQFPNDQGMLSARDDNPVRDWNQIYVPYCSGDNFGGNRSQVAVPGLLKKQNFLGHKNMKLILESVAEVLPDMQHMVFGGMSAGGFGSILNFDEVRTRFPNVPVTLLDDSGVPLEDNFIDPCLQKRFRTTWGLDESFPAACEDCRPANGGGLVNLVRYIREQHSDNQQGVIMSKEDSVLRFFFGYSKNSCQTLFPGIPGSVYAAGVESLRQNLFQGSVKSFIVPGSQHTFVNSSSFFTTTVDGQTLASWVEDLILNRAESRH